MDGILSTLDLRWVGSSFLVGFATLFWWNTSTRSKSKLMVDPDEASSIPWYPGSLWQFFQHFFSWDGPQHTLATFRSLQDTIFKVPLSVGPAFYLVSDPALARTVLETSSTTKFKDANQFFVDTTNGMNFVAAEGHRWKHVRKSTVAAFSSENVKLMVTVVETVLNQWIKDVLEADGDGANNINILAEMNKITSNVICQAAFDYDLQDEERQVLLSNLAVCWKEFGQEAGKNPLRQNRFTKWAFRGVWEAQRAAKSLHAHCRKMLEEYRAKKSTRPQPHKIVHMIDQDGDYANDHERVSDMVAFVIAGFDTTANTLAFTFRELAQNQLEQTKLRETLRACKTPDDARLAVKNVTREIMRLYPATATGSVKLLGEDIVVGDHTSGSTKRTLAKGSIVLTSFYSIQRSKAIFGMNADEFVPNRWENPTPEQLKAFLTFSAGKRNCQGQSLALAEMTEVVARLCRDYQFDVVEAGRAENFVLFKPIGTVLRMRKVE